MFNGGLMLLEELILQYLSRWFTFHIILNKNVRIITKTISNRKIYIIVIA